MSVVRVNILCTLFIYFVCKFMYMPKKWLKEPSTKEKLNAPMNHMIDVASY